MERKKNRFSELFFLALLATSLRPPDSALLRLRRDPNDRVSFGTDLFGDLMIEDVYSNSIVNDIFSEQHLNHKTPYIDNFPTTFSFLNSLGRFQPVGPMPEVNLLAFPISQQNSPSTHHYLNTIQASPGNSGPFIDDSLDDDDFGLSLRQSVIQEDEDSEDLYVDNEVDGYRPTDDSGVSTSSTVESNNSEEEDSLDTIISYVKHEQSEQNGEGDNFEATLRSLNEAYGLSFSELFDSEDSCMSIEVGKESDTEQQQKVDENQNPVEVDSVLDENEDNEDALSSISALFDDSDFQTLEEEAFGDWMPQATSTNFFTPENSGFYQLGDTAIAGCPVYETTHVQPGNSGYPTENNFGTVLYSSLTTLSNSQSVSNVSYIAGSEQDMNSAYMPTTLTPSQSSHGCFGCYDENNQLSTYQNVDPNLSIGYTSGYSIYSDPQSSHHYVANPDGNATSGHYCHSQIADDCFDKNSDSAVSSMSSERVHTVSENEWNESSSSSSRYNGDIAMSEHSADQSKRNYGAQKKYHLFGRKPKTNITEEEAYRAPEQGSYVVNEFEQQPQQQQQQQAHSTLYYPYQASVENFDANSYYQSSVNHNHTYEVAAPQPQQILEEIKTEIENEKPKKKKSTYAKSDSEESHFNRDERRAQALNIPILTEDIVNLPIDEFNDRLSKYDLTELQVSTIRDIRRRGKNKVAAQNCRKRKLDQINHLQTEVVGIVEHRTKLIDQINQYSKLVDQAKTQYNNLYIFLKERKENPLMSVTTNTQILRHEQQQQQQQCLPSTSKSGTEQDYRCTNNGNDSSGNDNFGGN